MIFNYGTTVSEMLKKFLDKIERPKLFKSEKIFFLYNAVKLKWDDNTKIEDKFEDSNIPSVIAVDVNQLLV